MTAPARLAPPDHEMTWTSRDARDLVVGITPFGEPRADLVVAIERAGGLGVLDLGSDAAAAVAAIERVRSRWHGRFAVRVGTQCRVSPADLPAEVDTLVTDAQVPPEVWHGFTGRVLVEVTSAEEAGQAVDAGAAGVIAKGSE
ncbi:MAG TPA: hypothetical protein VGS19_19280, partial [Streptosporangiaceae bacterium]|nr:hypothetical protein [Streptosporangiaceae bacterium]